MAKEWSNKAKKNTEQQWWERKKEHGRKEGKHKTKKTHKNAKNKVRPELRPLYNPLDLGLSTSNPKLVSFLTVYIFFPSHWPKLICWDPKVRLSHLWYPKGFKMIFWGDIRVWYSDICPTLEYTHATHYEIHI